MKDEENAVLNPASSSAPKPVFHAPQALDGWVWLRDGFKLFWRNPWALTSIVLVFMLLPMLLTLLPVVGAPVGMLMMPGLAAGAMYAAFCVSQSAHPLPHSIFVPFYWGPARRNLPRLRSTLILGALYAALVFLCFFAIRSLGGQSWQALEHLAEQQNAQGQGVDIQQMQALAEQAPQLGLMLVALLPVLTGLFLLFSRANMLALCFALNPAKALFFAVYSLWRSVMALLVYGLSLGVFSMILANLMLLHPFVYAIGLMVFTGVFLCSLWVSFGRSFPPPVVQRHWGVKVRPAADAARSASNDEPPAP